MVANWFSTTDLANAFFSIPVHEKSQQWFAFTLEGRQYYWTRLPQGSVDSPAAFHAAVNKQLGDFVTAALYYKMLKTWWYMQRKKMNANRERWISLNSWQLITIELAKINVSTVNKKITSAADRWPKTGNSRFIRLCSSCKTWIPCFTNIEGAQKPYQAWHEKFRWNSMDNGGQIAVWQSKRLDPK